MSALRWYAERLRAMGPLEVAHHARKRWRGLVDMLRSPGWAGVAMEPTGGYPRLPLAAAAPVALREALRRDADAILAGHWRVFGELELQVDDPPCWQKDYLAGADLTTTASAFTLNYRTVPPGTDIKLIWELSRWWHLTRLAMAAYVLRDDVPASVCLRWLNDWVKRNPPYCGWNWTSALEAGIRLIQMSWIDALLEGWTTPGRGGIREELARLRQQIVMTHAEYVWRHRSFGSSANNHLFGELVGLIVATVRWPAIAGRVATLEALQAAWEREVLRQFACDGGNREQALHYHLFSWELCWQARAALRMAQRTVAAEVDERLRRAARFYVEVQAAEEPWDYGDSDDAVITPFPLAIPRGAQEWRHWLIAPSGGDALEYWLGADRTVSGLGPIPPSEPSVGWKLHPESGDAVWRDDQWALRLDGSPLGYLATAAHGHLDALHLSLWLHGLAMIVDPGTGCYFVDPELRAWLASPSAHNGPDPRQSDWWPRRRGPFLWAPPHSSPTLERSGAEGCRVTLRCSSGVVERAVEPLEDRAGWAVHDRSVGLPAGFTVRWQFAPGTQLQQLAERAFRVTRAGAAMDIRVNHSWNEVRPVTRPAQGTGPSAVPIGLQDGDGDRAGITSPAFRQTEWAPYLVLITSRGRERGSFSTFFSAVLKP
jgi:hypothetical protein